MKDSPGLQVCDDLLDDIANLVDLLVEFLPPVQERASWRLPDGGDHAVPNIALVANPIAGIKRQQRLGVVETVRVMSTSHDGIGDPYEVAGQGAGDLHIHTCGLLFARVQFRVRGPGPAGISQSTISR